MKIIANNFSGTLPGSGTPYRVGVQTTDKFVAVTLYKNKGKGYEQFDHVGEYYNEANPYHEVLRGLLQQIEKVNGLELIQAQMSKVA